MQDVSAEWQSYVAQPVTQTCNCLKISHESENLFITDHDQSLVFLNEVYNVDDYLLIEPVKFARNLRDDGFEISTQINDTTISYDLIEAEFLKQAKYWLYQVNWADSAIYKLMKTGNIAAVKVNGAKILLNLHGIAKPLDNKYGRFLQEKCDAQFGDARCNINADLAAFNASGYVNQVVSDQQFEIDLPLSIESGYFIDGHAYIGQKKLRINLHKKISTVKHLIGLAQLPRPKIALADPVSLRIGCDKTYETCLAKYDNAEEFRGFAQMPGKDFKFAYPQRTLLET